MRVGGFGEVDVGRIGGTQMDLSERTSEQA